MQVDITHQVLIVHPSAISTGLDYIGTGTIKGQAMIDGKCFQFVREFMITFKPDPEAQQQYDKRQASIKEHRAVRENGSPF